MSNHSDEKVIKFGGDARGLESALTRAKRFIADVTKEVAKLNTEAAKGILGGGGRPGISSGPTPHPSMGGTPGSPDVFQAMARSSKSALQGMTATIRTETALQTQHLQRLRREVDSVRQAYQPSSQQGAFAFYQSSMGSARGPAGGQVNMAFGRQAPNLSVNQQGAFGFYQPGMGQAMGPSGQQLSLGLQHPSTAPGLMQGPQTFFQALRSGDQAAWSSTMPAKAAARESAALYASVLTPIGVAIGRTVVKAMTSGLQESSTAPHDYQRREIMRGEWGSEAQRIRHGDSSMVYALQMVRNDPKLRRDIGEAGAGGELTYLGGGFRKNESGGVDFNPQGRRMASSAWGSFKQGLGLDFVGGYNSLNRDLGDMPFQQSAEQLAMLQRVQEMKTVEFSRFNDFQAHTGSNEQAMATFGAGAGYYDKRGRISGRRMSNLNNLFGAVADGTKIEGLEYRNSAQRLLDSAKIRAGINSDQLASGYGAVQSTGGFGTAQQMGLTAAIAQRGHLGGVGQTLGTAAMGGNPNQFWASLNNLVGRGSGGIDVSAADVVGQTVAGTITSGGAASSGLGLLGAWGTSGRGDNAAQDMMSSRFMGAGLAAMGRVTGGTVDAYQSGSNLLSAIHALPAGSIGAQEYLSRIEPRLLFDIVGGAPLPKELQDRGITTEAVRQFSRSIMKRTYDRGIGASPNQKGQLNDVQLQTGMVQGMFGGNFRDYYRNQTGKQDQSSAIRQRAIFLTEAGLAGSDQEGQAFARLEAGLGAYGTLTGSKATAGRGVADYAAGSTDRMKETSDAVMAQDEHRAQEGADQSYRGAIQRAKPAAAGMAGIGQGEIRIEKVQVALDNLVRAMNIAADKIEGRWSAGGTFGVKR